MWNYEQLPVLVIEDLSNRIKGPVCSLLALSFCIQPPAILFLHPVPVLPVRTRTCTVPAPAPCFLLAIAIVHDII